MLTVQNITAVSQNFNALNRKDTAGIFFSWFWTNFAGNMEDFMDYDELQRPFTYLVCKL